MAGNLEEAWSRLSLTEEEAMFVEFKEETLVEKKEEIALSLLRRLLTDSSFNPSVMKNVLKSIWKPSKGLFFSATDKKYVLDEGPWAFNGNFLLIKEWTGLEQTLEIKFTYVKAFDVPGIRQTKKFAEFLGSQIGTFVDCDDSMMLGADKSLCFRVDIDVERPLHRGVSVKMGGKPMWIKIKYVKLPKFCYRCGRLGHVVKECETTTDDVAKEELQYGSWL
ncbi:hypothetical protein Cgig2_006315 [Carnegiea gigantea]|uniref:CCHC-type domain-containing protein n=1 Tax=Carnegiea gigantea TaxID=171969 RepID=A0A9Q1JL36_9CARY|nr:hypothetical protein Cgig2_006315 [Carnegiea gigantea]